MLPSLFTNRQPSQPIFAGKQRTPEQEAKAAERRAQHQLAQERRSAFPTSLKLLTPLNDGQVSPKKLEQILAGLGSNHAIQKMSPQLAKALEGLVINAEDVSTIESAHQQELELLNNLRIITNLFTSSVEDTGNLCRVISAIENKALRNHLITEYLLNYYTQRDYNLVKTLNSITDEAVATEWRTAITARQEPRFQVLALNLVTDAILKTNKELEELTSPKNNKQKTKKTDQKKDTPSPKLLQAKKELLVKELSPIVNRVSKYVDSAKREDTAVCLMELPDDILQSILPTVSSSMIDWVGLKNTDPTTLIKEFRENTCLQLLASKDAPVRINVPRFLNKMEASPVRDTLVDLTLSDPDDSIRAHLLSWNATKDIEPEKESDTKHSTKTKNNSTDLEVEKKKNTALMTPEQVDSLMLDLISKKINSPYYSSKYPLRIVTTYIDMASNDDLKTKLIEHFLNYPPEFEDNIFGLWAIYHLDSIKDEHEKVRITKQYANTKLPYTATQWGYTISSIKDDDTLLDVIRFIKNSQHPLRLKNLADNIFADNKEMKEHFIDEIFNTEQTQAQNPAGLERVKVSLVSIIEDDSQRLEEIKKLLTHPNDNIRRSSWRLLEFVKPASQRKILLKNLLNDPDLIVRKNAVIAIEDITNEADRIAFVKQVLNDEDTTLRTYLPRIIKKISENKRTRNRIISSLYNSKENPEAVRLAIIKHLDLISDPILRDKVIEHLCFDPDPEVRSNALQELSTMKNVRNMKALVQHYSGFSDSSITDSMSDSILKSVIPDLNEQLKDYDSMALLLQPFKKTNFQQAASDRKTSKIPIGFAHTLSSIHLASTLEMDAGEIRRVIFPQYYKLMAHAKSVVNMMNDAEDENIDTSRILNSFRNYRSEILTGLTLLGPEVLQRKLTLTLDPFEDFLSLIMKLPKNDVPLMQSIHSLSHRRNVNPEAVIRLVELCVGMTLLSKNEQLMLELEKLLRGDQNTPLDTNDLSEVYLRSLIDYSNPKSVITSDLLKQWDLEEVSTLVYMQDKTDGKKFLFKNIMTGMGNNSFEAQISDTQSYVGISNKETEKTFKTNGLDIDTWLHYPTEHVFSTLSDDDLSFRQAMSQQLFDETASQISQLMGSQRHNIPSLLDVATAKGLFTALKRSSLPVDFEEGQLCWQGDSTPSAEETKLLIGTISTFGKSRGVWKKASKESNTAILDIQTKLNASQSLIEECITENKPSISYTFKAWDRNPGHGLFLGTYGSNCVAMNMFNNQEILTFTTSKSIQMVELIDNGTKESVGVAFVYWVKDQDNQLYLAVDSMDVNKKYLKESKTTLIREHLVEFLQQYSQDVSGKKNVPIIIGKYNNDIPTKDLGIVFKDFNFVGNISSSKAYTELLGGKVGVNYPHRKEARLLAA